MRYSKKPNLGSKVKDSLILILVIGFCLLLILYRVSGSYDPRDMTSGDYITLLIIAGLVALYHFIEKHFPIIIYGRQGMKKRAEERAKDLEK